MKNLIMLAVAALALSGCDIEGRLNVAQTLSLKAKNGETLLLQPGSYKADVEAEDNKLKLEVKVNGKEKKVSFRTAGADIPKRNGRVFITAQQSGQAFDLDGIVETTTETSGRMRGTESCTTYDRVWFCRDVLVGHDQWGRPIYRRECGYETRPVPGRMEVEYHHETTTTTVDIAFMSPGTQNEVAAFEGARSSTQKVYDYRSVCYRW